MRMCWVAGCHIWKCVSVYIGFGIYPIRNRHIAEVLSLPRFYQIVSWKKNKKKIYTRFKQAIRLRFTRISSR